MHTEQGNICPGGVADGADEGPLGPNMVGDAGKVKDVAALSRVDGRSLPCLDAARAYSAAATLQNARFRRNLLKKPILSELNQDFQAKRGKRCFPFPKTVKRLKNKELSKTT